MLKDNPEFVEQNHRVDTQGAAMNLPKFRAEITLGYLLFDNRESDLSLTEYKSILSTKVVDFVLHSVVNHIVTTS